MEQNRFEECSEDFCECILSMNRERGSNTIEFTSPLFNKGAIDGD